MTARLPRAQPGCPVLFTARMSSTTDPLDTAAAAAIASASHLLIAAGAGLSADSGLPTFADVARDVRWAQRGLEYDDLCRTQMLMDAPACGYGFWSGCARAYAEAQPHEGYAIIERWASAKPSGNVYAYTSNIDGHFRRTTLSAHLCEIHGCAEEWICGGTMSSGSEAALSCTSTAILRPPIDDIARFERLCKQAMDEEDQQMGMAAASVREDDPTSSSTGCGCIGVMNSPPRCNSQSATSDCWDCLPPTCATCGGRLRPSVLMFGDEDSALLEHLSAASARYQEWEDAMESAISSDSTLSLVVLEIGCGTRVPSVRMETESVVRDARLRGARAHLIRINPDDAHETDVQGGLASTTSCASLDASNVTVIKDTALRALRRIEAIIKRKASKK